MGRCHVHKVFQREVVWPQESDLHQSKSKEWREIMFRFVSPHIQLSCRQVFNTFQDHIHQMVMVDFLSAVNGGWSAWNAVTTCFRQSSGAYTFYRVRRCDNPLPKYGGTCPGSSFESVPCQSGLNF